MNGLSHAANSLQEIVRVEGQSILQRLDHSLHIRRYKLPIVALLDLKPNGKRKQRSESSPARAV
jgi:hypothetical protein